MRQPMKLYSWLESKLPSLWLRWVLTTAAVGFYAVAFVMLYPSIGASLAALMVLPVALVAWFFGRRTGLLAAALSFPLNTLLFNLVGEPGWDIGIRQGALSVTFVFMMIALLVGQIRA